MVGGDIDDSPSKDGRNTIFGNHHIVLQSMVENPSSIYVLSILNKIESYHSYMDG